MNYTAITTCDICNGEDLGVVLWVSGCDVKCPGCHNKETWDPEAGKPFTEATLKLILTELERPELTRLTLSGGHPLMPCNRSAITDLILEVRYKFKDKIKIWLYTGYNYDELDPNAKLIADMCDYVVDGPYMEQFRNLSLQYRGSANQRIIKINQK